MKLPNLPSAGPLGPAIEVVDGQPLTRNADGSMHRASVAELVQALETCRKENQALRNLAENLEPGPISEALAATLHVATWRQRAAHWLRHEAADQELTNQLYPAHVAEYKSWKERPDLLRTWANLLAGKLEQTNRPDPGAWLLYFEDTDHGHEVYMGAGADDAAFRRYQQASTQWSCHLFARVEGADRKPPTWQGNRLFWALRQLLDELPEQRDWLSPSIERELRDIVGKAHVVRRHQPQQAPTWQARAAEWLREVATQEVSDAAYAGHASMSAKERAAFLNGLADQVER